MLLGGVLVSRASLHNFRLVKHSQIRLGDQVKVERKGDVIPYIDIDAYVRDYVEDPTGRVLPFAQSEIRCPCEQRVLLIPEGDELFCRSPMCETQLERR